MAGAALHVTLLFHTQSLADICAKGIRSLMTAPFKAEDQCSEISN